MIESGTIRNQDLIHAIESDVNDAGKDHGWADKGEGAYNPTVEAIISDVRYGNVGWSALDGING